MLVDEIAAQRAELLGDEIEGLVPADFDPAGVLVAALARIGPPHRLEDAVRIVELLEEAVGLDADFAVGRMHAAHGEVGLDLGRDPVDELDRKEVGPVDALIAVGRDFFPACAALTALLEFIPRVSISPLCNEITI